MLAGHIGNYGRYEIERKYVLAALPENLPTAYDDIHDVYLPNSNLRLRTVKSPSGEILARKLTQKQRSPALERATNVITSLYLTAEDLSALGDLRGHSLNKWRYRIPFGEHVIAVDVFKGTLKGLLLAEVEFLDPQSMERFRPPSEEWREVTDDIEFSGGFLARYA